MISGTLEALVFGLWVASLSIWRLGAFVICSSLLGLRMKRLKAFLCRTLSTCSVAGCRDPFFLELEGEWGSVSL